MKWLLLFAFAGFAVAQNPAISAIVNGGDFQGGLAFGGIATIFGKDLSSKTSSANIVPLPINLGGVQINVCNGGTCQQAGLFYASPSQINFLIPSAYSGLWSGGSGNMVTVSLSVDGNVAVTVPVLIAPAEPRPFPGRV